MPTAIVLADAQGRILLVNAGAEKLFGYGREELIGRLFEMLLPEPVRAERPIYCAAYSSHSEARPTGRARDLFALRKDGSEVPVEIVVNPIETTEGPLILSSINDITERKQAEATLREREEQLRLYAEHSPAAIAMLDRDMKYLAVSRRWMEDFHLGDRAIIGRSHYEVFPEIPQRWIEIHRRCLEDAVEECDEEAFPRADGTTEWIRREIRPWRQADGSIGGIIIFSEVITARKRAEEALRESEARTQLLVKSSNVGLWDWNLVTDDVYFSREWKAQLGRTDAEVSGRYEEWECRLHPEDRDAALAAVKDYLEGRCSDYAVEFRLRHKDGSWRWILARGELIRDAAGQAVRLLGCHVDITGRKQAEAALRESEARFQAFMDHTPAMVIIKDAEGRYVYFNKTVEHTVRATLDELRGKTNFDRLPNETAQQRFGSARHRPGPRIHRVHSQSGWPDARVADQQVPHSKRSRGSTARGHRL
jgi:PAS domain S-box-containing protein